MTRIIAIGGGEVRLGETRLIDEEIVKVSGKENPRLLFIPTASHEAEGYVELINQYFGKELGCEVETLYLLNGRANQESARKQIEEADIVYVGGGNTKSMMRTWKEYGVDLALQEAARKGTVLSGLSAGSICWFNSGCSDSESFEGSDEWDYIHVDGINLIDAIHCPHLNEDGRYDGFKKMLKETGNVGIGLDNCCALDINDGMYRIMKSKSEAKGYKMYFDGDEFYAEELSNSTYEPVEKLVKKANMSKRCP